MRRKTAVVLGVAGAALALTASSAFTAGGVTLATGLTGFLGGSADVTVTGTEIRAVTYNDVSGDATKVGSIDFQFSDHNANGKTPSIDITLASGTSTGWTCTAVASSTTTGQTAYSETTCTKGSSSGDVAKSNLTSVKLTVA